MKRPSGLSVILLVALHAAPARAKAPDALPTATTEPAPPAPVAVPAPAAAPKQAYYGHYILLCDVASLSLMLVGANVREGGPLFGIGAVSWIVAAPAFIHSWKGHPGAAAASRALRLGLPMVGALIGWSMAPQVLGTGLYDPCGLLGCGPHYAAQGLLAGMVVAALADQLVAAVVSGASETSWQPDSPQPPPPSTPPRSSRRRSRWTGSVTPTPLTTASSIGAALVGTF